MSRIGALLLLLVLAACVRPDSADRGDRDRDTNGQTDVDGRTASDEIADLMKIVAGGRGNARITYQPEVRILKQEDWFRALAGLSSDGFTLLFDTAQPEFRSLREGDVFMVEGLIARKVLATEVIDKEIAVLTQAATIEEVVRDGQVELDVPVRFSAAHTRTSSARPSRTRPGSAWGQLADFAVPTAYAQSPEAEALRRGERAGTADAVKGLAKNAIQGVFEGWETTFSAVPGDGRADISLHLTKDVGGFKAVITGEGYLSDFDFSSGIDVEQGFLDRMELAHRKLNGVINFNWEIGKETPGGHTDDDRIKLPAALSIPLYQYLSGFPLFLEISGALIIQPVVTGGQQYSQGSFRVTYDGTQSFRVKEGNLDADGNSTGEVEFVKSQNISALAPVGMVVAVAAPRIELSFGTTKILSPDNLATAAKRVDMIAEQLIKRTLGEEAYDRLKASPLGDLSMSEAVKNSVASDAAGYIEIVSTAATTHSGSSVITPCTRTELMMAVRVGASAQVFGQKLGETKRDLHKHEMMRVDPPGTRLCTEL